MAQEHEGVSDLPGVLAEIAEIAGRDAAMELALKLGGEALYVPRPARLDPDHRLVVVVGVEASVRIAERFQGEAIDVPLARRALTRWMAARGVPKREIARRLGFSASAARRYLQ